MINKLQKQNIKTLKPYVCARDLYKEGVFLDANENFKQWIKIDYSKMANLNRYPDSRAELFREKLTKRYLKNFDKENIFIGSGSDEIIDLLIRAFVEPNEFVMVMNPSYSVYEVQSAISNVGVKPILLKPDFGLDIEQIKQNIQNVKILFLCSPNNPTGNLISKNEIREILSFFKGILVIDEAYIEFADLENSLVDFVSESDRVVVLRTFSKAWGLAGIRLGYAVASPECVDILMKVKESYNVNQLTVEVGLQALDQVKTLNKSVEEILDLKNTLETELKNLGLEVLNTQANFILVRVPNSTEVYKKLALLGVIVRDRSNLPYLENVLRVTVGSESENKGLIRLLKKEL